MKTKGFTFVELMIIIIYMGAVTIAMSTLIILTRKATVSNVSRIKCQKLALGLMEEVVSRRWTEKGSSSADLGPEAGEQPGDKNSFDDVDDFNGWEEAPPQLPDGVAETGLSGFRRTVNVEYIEPGDIHSETATNLKKITVAVYKGDSLIVSLQAVRSAH